MELPPLEDWIKMDQNLQILNSLEEVDIDQLFNVI